MTAERDVSVANDAPIKIGPRLFDPLDRVLALSMRKVLYLKCRCRHALPKKGNHLCSR